jgi:quercetin dioxygenase-like cupin family protein
MYRLHERDAAFRFGDSGPKYIMRGPRSGFGRIVLKPGMEARPHVHGEMEENFFVLEGEVEFEVNGESFSCGPGAFVHLEPGDAHNVKNVSSAPASLIFSLAPYCDGDRTDIG